MHKRVVLIGLSILLVAAVVFAAVQEYQGLGYRSHTARIQELHPLSDTVAETPAVTDTEILNALLTEEQRAALEQQPKDIASAFSQYIADTSQPAAGASNA